MKKVINSFFLLFFIITLYSCIKKKDNTFKIVLSNFYRKAFSYTYVINNDSVTIYHPFYNEKSNKTLIFSKRISGDSLNSFNELLERIEIDELYDVYSILGLSSGTHIYINFYYGNKTKKIELFEYYLPDIDSLITEINAIVPEKYFINYDKIKIKGNMESLKLDDKTRKEQEKKYNKSKNLKHKFY